MVLADNSAIGFLAALEVLFVWYRVRLFGTLFASASPPFGMRPGMTHALAMTKGLASDVLMAVVLGLAYLALHYFFKMRLGFIARTAFFKCIETAGCVTVLFAAAFLMLTHYRVVFEIESGLNLMLLQLGSAELAHKDVLRLMTTADVIFLCLPVVGYMVFLFLPVIGRTLIRRTLPVIVIIAIMAWLQPWAPRLAPELLQNPLCYLGHDLVRAPLQFYSGQRNPFANRRDVPGQEQMNSIRLIDPAFVFTNPPGKPTLLRPLPHVADPKNWNVMFFVMESTGSDYVFDTSLGNEMPMPFLQEMAEKGLFFTNNHTACNSSASAALSIFSGLYPRPTHELFAHLDSASIPMLNWYLRETHHSFLINSASLTYCFPAGLFRNNGIDEIETYDSLPKGTHPEFAPLARNEFDVASYVLQKLDTVREPFVGIYWSFIPHHPYSDYGPETRVLPNLNNKRHRYYNNLRMLDTQLRRVFEHMRDKGLLDRTILVFVGDHGEAFGQHPGTWAHIGGSFSESFRAPVIFYQPRLIEPQTITRVTSHVDILPTLFDLMGFVWDENKLQGESVFRESRRRYIFSMDCLADYMSVVDTNMCKVSIGFENGNVFAYNLAKDPGEKLPMNEDAFKAHLEAIVKFRNYQTHLIDSYNAAILGRKAFP